MSRISSQTVRAAVVAIGLLAAAPAVWADVIEFIGTGADGRSASAIFESSGGTLTVTLTNTSLADMMVPSDILTGVFFNAPVTLSPVSAVVAPGSFVNFGPGGNVGGEWAYNTFSTSFGANQGISSSGLGLFGPSDLFGGPNLDGPVSPAGLSYGITSAGDNPLTGNGGLLNGPEPLIQNSVVFTLHGWSGDLSSISNVFFQYGTSLDEPRIPGNAVPEPGTLALLGLGLGGLYLSRRKRQLRASR